MIARIGLVGAGTMGRGIAELAIRVGVPVVLHDAMPGAAAKARELIATNLAKDVERGRLEAGASATTLERLAVAGSLAEIAETDLVIEAIVENLAAKQTLFAELDRHAAPATLFATNTSSLAVTAIAAVRPDRFAGLHFFNPPTRVRVVEIVRGAGTAPATIAALQRLAARLGQRTFLVTDTPGFLVNHIGRALTGEALRILDEGVASAAEIDRIATGALHFKMGPFELLDLVGLDVSAKVTEEIWAGFDREPRFALAPIAGRQIAAGRLGRKTGRGFYDYTPDGKAEVPAPRTFAAGPAGVRLVGMDQADQATVAALFPAGTLSDSPDATLLVAPLGTRVADEARRLGLDPPRVVGIDALFTDHVTLAATDAALAANVAAAISASGRAVSIVADGPAMPAQRIAAMLVLIGAEAAGRDIGTPSDIDAAARLALAYPRGPLELGDALGAARIGRIAASLHASTGDPRWRPSAWLDAHVASGERMAEDRPSRPPAAD